ncbi:MAG: protein kinase [Methylobacter sp.]|nr:protein kinase [Methylococcales bacterium]MDD5114152.1 protein kinase [Methylobacter sp.]
MERIDNYKIVEKIGEGGMGEVYKGIDTMLEREVAIKMLRPELSSRDDIVERFRSEAIALGRLNHSHIATVYNFGRVDEQYYMAMEFVSGETLDSIIQQHGRLSWRDAVQYAIQALEGLAHAHQSNVIHRDIKPANIIVNGQNTLKLLDFGIARILQTARLTRTQHTIGTPEYMSPEQHQGKEVDARSDIYAVGMLLYEMLTGKLPFRGNTQYALIKAIIEDKPTRLRHVDRSIPLTLEKQVLRALEKKPEKRFANAKEFIHALTFCLTDSTAEPKQTRQAFNSTKLANLMPLYQRPRTLVLAIALVCGAGYVLWQTEQQAQYSIMGDKTKVVAVSTNNESGHSKSSKIDLVHTFISKPVDKLTAIDKTMLKQLQEAAEAGDASVQAYLGAMYVLGKGVTQDITIGLEWTQKAAEQGNVMGQDYLAHMFFNGLGVKKNEAKGVEWLEKAAAQDYIDAQTRLAERYYEEGTPEKIAKAFRWYQKAAELGDAQAQYNLGVMYQKGRNVPVDMDKAFSWYQKSANQGNILGLYNLGYCHLHGLGTTKDVAKAAEILQKAVDQDYAPAQAVLASILFSGIDIGQDLPRAFGLAQRAAFQGDKIGQLLLGIFYKDGIGTPKSLAKAVEWLQKSSDQGSADAKLKLLEAQAQLKQQSAVLQTNSKPKQLPAQRKQTPAIIKTHPVSTEKTKQSPKSQNLSAELAPPAEKFGGFIPRNR